MRQMIKFLAGLLCFLPTLALAASPASVIHLPSVAALQAGNFTNVQAIALDSYYAGNLYGGGMFSPGASGCTPNSGTILKDAGNNCWYRQSDGGHTTVLSFGSECDGVSTASDGAITGGLNQFTSNVVTFQPADATAHKVIEFNYANGTAWTDTIASYVNSSTITTTDPAPATFPGPSIASNASYNDINNGGDDSPGSGYGPGDTWTAMGGTFTSAASGQVTQVQFVGASIGIGGTLYQNGDTLTGSCVSGGSASGSCASGGGTQMAPPQIMVTVGSGGMVVSFTIIQGGAWRGAVPSSITWTGGNGSGFTTTLLSSNGSFGLWQVSLTQGGSYSVPPTNPVSVTDSGSGTGGSIDLGINSPSWYYGTDDTTPIQNSENYIEAIPPSGNKAARSLAFPSGRICLARGITIGGNVAWFGDGANQSQLVQIAGSPGISVNGSPYGFIAEVPASRSATVNNGNGTNTVGMDNMFIYGMTTAPSVTVGTTPTAYSNDGIMLTSIVPRGEHPWRDYKNNVHVSTFPGNIVEENRFQGDLHWNHVELNNSNNVDYPFAGSVSNSSTITGISSGAIAAITAAQTQVGTLSVNGPTVPEGTTVTAIGSSSITVSQNIPGTVSAEQFIVSGGGDCLYVYHNENPTHIFGLIASGCDYGLHFNKAKQWAIHSYVSFGNNINLFVDGQTNTRSEIVCFDCQITGSNQEGALFNQVNEAFYCYGCIFFGSNKDQSSADSPADSNIVMALNAGGAGGGIYTSLSLIQPAMQAPVDATSFDNNIVFSSGPGGNHYCTCKVSINGLTNQEISAGIPIVVPSSQLFAVSQTAPQTGIACYASGGRTNAVATYASMNTVTGASSGASCLLPPADGSNTDYTVVNVGSNSINEFAAGTDAINGGSSGGDVAIAAGTGVRFSSPAVGVWAAVP